MLWQHVVLCKLYAAENAPDCGGVSCFMQRETDFSKEQCSSLKMILGSKHVGAILNVLMYKVCLKSSVNGVRKQNRRYKQIKFIGLQNNRHPSQHFWQRS